VEGHAYSLSLTLACKRLQIGTDVVLIITNIDDMLFRFINIDDLERPSKKVFRQFFAILGCSAHFRSELWRNAWK